MIPAWNPSHVLPPIRPGQKGTSPDRSPYSVSLPQVVERFASSPDRIAILRGLLAYRDELGKHGIFHGFQWLDGSFMEHKEVLEEAPPNDMDVVTFFRLPEGETQKTLAPKISDLFNSEKTKLQYHVDAYPCILGEPMENNHVKRVSYWYSMWSHRRNSLWKGFLQVNLSQEEDHAASGLLNSIEQEGSRQ